MELTAFTLGVKPRGTLPAISVDATPETLTLGVPDYLAGREDWDVALFAISVNMTGGGFTPAGFRERADYFVTESGDAEETAAFREELRSVVAESPHDTLSLVEGPDLLDPSDLTRDVLYPGDDGMRTIGEGLAPHLDAVTE